MVGAGSLFDDILCSGICISKMQGICWLLAAFAYINVKSVCFFEIKIREKHYVWIYFVIFAAEILIKYE